MIISTAYQCNLLWINKINTYSNISCAGSHWTWLSGAKYINGRNDSGCNDSDKQLGNKTQVRVLCSIWTWRWGWQYRQLSIHQDVHHALRHDVGTGERSSMPRVYVAITEDSCHQSSPWCRVSLRDMVYGMRCCHQLDIVIRPHRWFYRKECSVCGGSASCCCHDGHGCRACWVDQVVSFSRYGADVAVDIHEAHACCEGCQHACGKPCIRWCSNHHPSRLPGDRSDTGRGCSDGSRSELRWVMDDARPQVCLRDWLRHRYRDRPVHGHGSAFAVLPALLLCAETLRGKSHWWVPRVVRDTPRRM